MLSYRYWQQRFGGDRQVLSRTLRVNSKPYQIIGVLPREFRFQNENPAIVIPLQFDRAKTFVGNFSYQGLARLKPGVTLEQANADVARMLPMLGEKFPPPPGMSMKIFEEARIGPNLRLLKKDVIGDVDKVLWALMAAVGLVLLIACANVANLLLVRAEGRQQEIAIRSALGANWTTIARSLLGESLSLAALGGVLGVGVAYGALRLLLALGPGRLPRLAEISIDLPTLVFAVAISLLAGLVFGLIPVLKYATPNLSSALHSAGRGSSEGRERHRARNTLVVVQVALALVLLIGSGLMIRTFWALHNVHPGFTNPERILTARVYIPPADVPKAEDVTRLHHGMLQRVAALPGVERAALTTSITMDGNDNNDPIFAEDKTYTESQLPPLRRFKYISPGFFQAMGNRLAAGRDLTWTDTFETRPNVIISECLARELWGDPAKAVGKRIRSSPKSRWHEVVGVAADDRDDGVHRKATATVYWPLLLRDQWVPGVEARRSLIYTVRSARVGSPGFLREVQQAIWSLNPSLPIADVRTVAEIQRRSMARTSFTLAMLALAGFMALLLGVIGIYGVISYSVTRRTREIGIRIALGAANGRVQALFLREGLALTLIGVALGLAVSAGLTRLISSLLFGVTPLDPVTYVAVPLALAAAAALAAYVPARRATRIHPLDALRTE
jgi:predicted permease